MERQLVAWNTKRETQPENCTVRSYAFIRKKVEREKPLG
jgi:hypothetical protein